MDCIRVLKIIRRLISHAVGARDAASRAGRRHAPRPAAPIRKRASLWTGRRGWSWAAIALGAALVACGEAQDPRLREPVVLAEAELLQRLLERFEALEGTPLGRRARTLRSRLGDCPTVWSHPTRSAPAARDGELPLADLDCLTRSESRSNLHALAQRERGAHAGFVQWPLGDDGRLALRLDIDAAGHVSISGSIEPPRNPGALALLLPGREAPAPPAIEPSAALLHARLRPAEGFRISDLIPAGGQADRLFALRGRLLEGALLAGTWELAFMPPAPDGRLPLAVAAAHHRLEMPIREAVDEALDQLEQTWPIRRTPRRFAMAGGRGAEGGCFLELPLLPELAPCWVVTPDALVVGYRAEAVEAALAPTLGAGQESDRRNQDAQPTRSGLEIDFDRLQAVDERIAPMPGSVRPGALWSRFELYLEPDATGHITLDGRLEARS
jgi:hypothetical protein